MAIIRMNEQHRQFLYDLAKTTVTCAAEGKADKTAYDKAAPMVRKLVEDRYPPKDMKLLLKYEQARHDNCIRLQLTAGGVVELKFRDDDKGPLVPGQRNGYGCSNRMYAADEAASTAINASILAADVYKKAMSKKLEDYKALIWTAATLDQIETVWPPAAALRERVGRSLPVVLSDEVIARIKADVSRLKQAA
jgi:hypothetical protein